MKKLIIIFTFTIFLLPFSFSQEYGWVKINTDIIPGTIDFTDVFFVSENVGWITTNTTNKIFKTNDGGLSFITQTTQYGTQAVCAFDTTYAYAGGLQGRVYYTTDGGLNWPAIGSIGVTLDDLDFASSSQGYASGSSGTVYSIAGASVTNLNCPSSSTLSGISAPSVDHVWVCGGNRIYYYNGTDFTSQPAPPGTFNDIHFINNQKGWVVGDAGIIGYTEDGGVSWDKQTNPDPQDRTLFGVFFYNEDYGWAVGGYGVILHTTDGGTNWAIVGEGLTTENLSAIHFTSPTNGYVAGGNKTLLKYGELTGTNEVTETLQFEIFPNPAKCKFKVQGQKFKVVDAKIEIYDLNGRKLIEKQIPSGNETVEVDVSSLQSGIYFCHLISENKSTSQKLIIQK
jgi:photosystem II stability/assembly factor-like uncharacterized protein